MVSKGMLSVMQLEENQHFSDDLKGEWGMHSADDLVVCMGDLMDM